MIDNLQVVFSKGYIRVRTVGPVNKQNYAKLKPFLLEHFRYNPEDKCYEVYTCNHRFVSWFFEKLREAGFNPQVIGRFKGDTP